MAKPGTKRAEIAIVVGDAFQKRGIGSTLVERLVAFAKDEGLELLTACFLAENQPVAKVFKRLGFTISEDADPQLRRAELSVAATHEAG